ncbi:MAG: TrkH family potassium uptake protein [Bacteroidetes bacterium]|jgi:trk system potassium uptake protein TrkH|nr:TrkH family potassium uptake protein [Bacteroidota bacterium]
MINFQPISNIIGLQTIIVGLLMWTSVPFGIYYGDGDAWPLFWSGLMTVAAGSGLWFYQFDLQASISKKEGYIVVVLGWVLMVLFGTLPYLITGVTPGFIDAFFETMSGMTTTGATIFTDIERLPRGLLFWRSMTQWIGGMGIIVLTVAIFPLLGFGGTELFVAEAPGPTSDKLHPRIQETAKRLWFIYLGLTALLCLLLTFTGLGFYDGINHALTTMATGGFSTKNDSIANFRPAVQYIIILFMLFAGTNYAVLYYGIKRKWKSIWRYDEFKFYLLLVSGLSLFLSLILVFQLEKGLETSFRESLFTTVSLITTTGYVNADYTSWTPIITFICFTLLFFGANAGSTSGGIKLVRHAVFLKNIYLELKRILHPRAVIPLRLNGTTVRSRILINILVFLLIYISIFLIGSVVLIASGLSFSTSIGAVATSLGNVGPAIGSVGPVDNFAHLPATIKLFLSFLMLLGRLELFTVILLFMPFFWQKA